MSYSSGNLSGANITSVVDDLTSISVIGKRLSVTNI